MKATELMLGDWVKCTDPRCEGHQVDLIDNGNEEVGLDGEIDNFENIIPIPITPEILEKNGIKLFSTYTHPYRDGEWEEGELEEAMKHYPMYVYQTLNPNITFVIRPNEQELKVCSSNYKTRVEKKEEVIFVHELQHALLICGIEKDVVL